MVWHDQVAVVTWAVRGIGWAIARRLAREGAAVCVNYAVRADAAETLQEIRSEGGRAIAHCADVAEGAARRVAERAMRGCIGAPDDIANAVAFFAAPDSGRVTGQVLAVDGGRMDCIAAG